MLWDAKSFIYNGVNSDTFEIAIGYLDSPEFSDNGLVRSVSKGETSMIRRRANVYGVNEEEPIKFTFHCFPDPCKTTDNWDIPTSTKINSWLFEPTIPQKLTFLSENDPYVINFYAICTNIEDSPAENGIAGKTLTFECDSPFGYTPPEVKKGTCSGTQTLSIVHVGDEEFEYPDYEISVTADSEIIINNKTTGVTVDFLPTYTGKLIYSGRTGMVTDETGTVVPFYKILKSPITNYDVSLKLTKGKNIIELTGDFDYKITNIHARRVGIV